MPESAGAFSPMVGIYKIKAFGKLMQPKDGGSRAIKPFGRTLLLEWRGIRRNGSCPARADPRNEQLIRRTEDVGKNAHQGILHRSAGTAAG